MTFYRQEELLEILEKFDLDWKYTPGIFDVYNIRNVYTTVVMANTYRKLK